MDSAQSNISTTQKLLALLFLVILIVLGVLYINNQTGVITRLFGKDTPYVLQPDNTNPQLDIAVYCDMTSGACKQTIQNLRDFQTEYSSDIRLHHYHLFSLDNAAALAAAVATEIAAKSDQFWAMQFALYDYQDEWMAGGNIPNSISEYAELIELDGDDFEAELVDGMSDSSAYYKRIQQDLSLAEKEGITTAPTVIINGTTVTEPLTIGLLEDYLD